MKTLNLRYPLIVICMAAAGLYAGCDLEELCGNGEEDVGECDYLTGEHSCAADCTGGGTEGEGEGEEGEGETPACTEGEVKCTEDNTGTTVCDAAGAWGDPAACEEGQVCIPGEGDVATACGAAPCEEGKTQCSEDGLSLSTCNAEGAWDEGVECGAGKHCVSGDNVEAQCDWIRDMYRWIRVCSTTTRTELDGRPVGTKPGPDIDAIEVFDSEDNLKGAVTQAGEGMLQDSEFDDVTEALGAPDATGSADAAGCQGFTSIGLKGHYMVVGTEFDIVPGDKVVVHEVPNCDLDPNDLRVESSRLDLAVLSKDGLWFELAAKHEGGQGTYTVQADAGVTESAVCEPCAAGDADCEI